MKLAMQMHYTSYVYETITSIYVCNALQRLQTHMIFTHRTDMNRKNLCSFPCEKVKMKEKSIWSDLRTKKFLVRHFLDIMAFSPFLSTAPSASISPPQFRSTSRVRKSTKRSNDCCWCCYRTTYRFSLHKTWTRDVNRFGTSKHELGPFKNAETQLNYRRKHASLFVLHKAYHNNKNVYLMAKK